MTVATKEFLAQVKSERNKIFKRTMLCFLIPLVGIAVQNFVYPIPSYIYIAA